jgi:Ca-activated chloride channel homolog
MYLTFNDPRFLWYLLSVPLLVISHYAFLKYARKRAMRFANFEALKRISNERIMTKNHIILILRVLILSFLILAISGTSLWYMGASDQNDYIIAIDVSSSMSSGDFSPSRLEAAKRYSDIFISNAKPDAKIGLVSFSGASFIEYLPSKDRAGLRSAVSDLSFSTAGGTNIPDAIITSTNLLIPSEKGKAVILLTDGSNTAGYYAKDPIGEGIKYAKLNNIIMYTIGIGSTTGPIGYLPEYYNISSVYDENVLLRIANETSGRYYSALDNQELEQAFRDIVGDSRVANIQIDLTMGLLITALGLIFLEWGLISTRYRSLP